MLVAAFFEQVQTLHERLPASLQVCAQRQCVEEQAQDMFRMLDFRPRVGYHAGGDLALAAHGADRQAVGSQVVQLDWQVRTTGRPRQGGVQQPVDLEAVGEHAGCWGLEVTGEAYRQGITRAFEVTAPVLAVLCVAHGGALVLDE